MRSLLATHACRAKSPTCEMPYGRSGCPSRRVWWGQL